MGNRFLGVAISSIAEMLFAPLLMLPMVLVGLTYAQVCHAVAETPSKCASKNSRNLYSPPSACSEPILAVPANDSYLNNYNYRFKSRLDIREKILEPEKSRSVRQELEDLNRSYRLRSQYSLVGQDEAIRHKERIESFSGYILRHIVTYQLNENLKKAEKNSSDVRTFRKGYDSVQKVVKGSAAVNVSETSSTRFGVNTDLPHQKGRVFMDSGLINAAFDVDYGGTLPLDATSIVSPSDASTPQDTYKASLTKGLPLEIDSEVSYGFVSKQVVTALKRSFFDSKLNFELADVRAVEASKKPEETLKLSYGLRF
jgi:hypothetical protein